MQRWLIATLPVLALTVAPVWAQQSSGGQKQQMQQQQQAEGQQKAQDADRQQAKMQAPKEVILEQGEDQLLAENILGATVYAARAEGSMAAGEAKTGDAKTGDAKQAQQAQKQDQAQQQQQQAQQGKPGMQSDTSQQARMSDDEMGDEIGTVEDLIFDKDHKLTGVVIGVGGFLGIGQKSVGVAMDALTEQRDDDGEIYFTTNLNQDALEEAPEFLTAEEQQDRAELRQVRAEQRERGGVADMQRQGTAAGPASSGTGAGAGAMPSQQPAGQEPAKKQ